MEAVNARVERIEEVGVVEEEPVEKQTVEEQTVEEGEVMEEETVEEGEVNAGEAKDAVEVKEAVEKQVVNTGEAMEAVEEQAVNAGEDMEEEGVEVQETPSRAAPGKRRRREINVTYSSPSSSISVSTRTTRSALETMLGRTNDERFLGIEYDQLLENRLTQLSRATDNIHIGSFAADEVFDDNSVENTIGNVWRLELHIESFRRHIVTMDFILCYVVAELYRVLTLFYSPTDAYILMTSNGFRGDAIFQKRLIIGNNVRVLKERLNVACLVAAEFFPKTIVSKSEIMNEYLDSLEGTAIYTKLQNIPVPAEVEKFFDHVAQYMAGLERNLRAHLE